MQSTLDGYLSDRLARRIGLDGAYVEFETPSYLCRGYFGRIGDFNVAIIDARRQANDRERREFYVKQFTGNALDDIGPETARWFLYRGNRVSACDLEEALHSMLDDTVDELMEGVGDCRS